MSILCQNIFSFFLERVFPGRSVARDGLQHRLGGGGMKPFDQIIFEHQVNDLKMLKGIAKKVDSSFLTDEILHYIYQSLRKVIPFTRLGLAVMVDDGKALRSVWARSERPELSLPIGYQATLEGSSLHTIIRTGKPRIINNLEELLAERPDSQSTQLILQEGIRSNLACPLLVDSGPFGIIFFSSTEYNTYKDAHIQSFQRIASEIAAILQHGYKYEEEFAARQQNSQEIQNLLPERVGEEYSSDQHETVTQFGSILLRLAENYDESIKEVQFLSGITHRLNAGLNLDEILDYIYEEFHKIIPYQRISFATVNKDGAVHTRWVRSQRPNINMPPGYTLSLEETSLKQLGRVGRSRIINDLEEHIRSHPQSISSKLLLQEGFHSSLTCPLNTFGKTVGFLFFSCIDPYMYQDAHIEIFEAIAGQLATILEKARLYQKLKKERMRSERLLKNMLPASVAERLKDGPQVIADHFEETTILFADIVEFSQWELSPTDLVVFLNELFSAFDDLCDKYEMTKLRTLGDGYIAVAGVPFFQEDHVERAAMFALEMMQVAHSFTTPKGTPVELRIGLHSGSVVAGVIGKQTYQYDLWGKTMNMASRMESHGVPGKIQISTRTYHLLQEKFYCEKRGRIELKGGSSEETYLLFHRKE